MAGSRSTGWLMLRAACRTLPSLYGIPSKPAFAEHCGSFIFYEQHKRLHHTSYWKFDSLLHTCNSDVDASKRLAHKVAGWGYGVSNHYARVSSVKDYYGGAGWGSEERAYSTQAASVVLSGGADGKYSLPSAKLNVKNLVESIQFYGNCYWQLSKARLSMLVVSTAGAGYVMGSGATIDWACLGWTCLGTMLAASSANTFNQVLEVKNDALMKRTMRRPLPSRRLSLEHASAWAVTSGIAGVSLLAFQTNSLVAGLGAANILLYTLAYTPLKQIHPVNTWIGAVVGAIPPLMGWAAATGQLDLGGWVLAAVLYFWQIPHFMALASLCSNDYAAGGYKMLSGKRAALVAFRNCLYLLPIGFIAHHLGLTSGFFGAESLVLTAGMGITAAMFYSEPTAKRARQLFRTSLLYLPIFMGAMLLHRLPNLEQHKELATMADHDTVGEEVLFKDSEESLERALPKFDDRSSLESPRPPIAFVSIAPFPFLPAPGYRTPFP